MLDIGVFLNFRENIQGSVTSLREVCRVLGTTVTLSRILALEISRATPYESIQMLPVPLVFSHHTIMVASKAAENRMFSLISGY